jgi:hypothetical protein
VADVLTANGHDRRRFIKQRKFKRRVGGNKTTLHSRLLGREEKADEFMRQLVEYDFDFERAALKCRTQLTQLKARTGDFCFEIFSGELLVFHKWVMQKAK